MCVRWRRLWKWRVGNMAWLCTRVCTRPRITVR
jgi:hypothetical protein